MCIFFFFQAEDGIRDLVRSRGLGDVYKRQAYTYAPGVKIATAGEAGREIFFLSHGKAAILSEAVSYTHLTLPTSDLV